ncbi:MAG: hypothetical protein IID09_06070, partial [Candidatus Hydrogenedentes bacterium]|nr:hypothetical protein [Candidatus Hydrogenedentota bacterium]
MTETGGNSTVVRWRDSLIVRVLALCVVLVLCLLGAVYFLTGHYFQQVVRSIEQRAAEIAQTVKIELDAHPEEYIDLEQMPDNLLIALEEGVPIEIRPVTEVEAPNTITPRVTDEGYYFEVEQNIQLQDGSWVELKIQLDMDPQTELVRAFKNRFLMALTAVFM